MQEEVRSPSAAKQIFTNETDTDSRYQWQGKNRQGRSTEVCPQT